MNTIRERFAAMRPHAISQAEADARAAEDDERERAKRSRRLRELARHRPGEPFREAFRRLNVDRCNNAQKT